MVEGRLDPTRASADAAVAEGPWPLRSRLEPVGLPLSQRVSFALRRRSNWLQLLKFAVVGASGYVVNLAVYGALLGGGIDFRLAAVCSFLVAVTNNYTWNRLWTFRAQRGHLAYQGLRFLLVSVLVLGANLCLLSVLVLAGADRFHAQAAAILMVTPLNFVGNKLWSFRIRHARAA